jgi:hypothetical protein
LIGAYRIYSIIENLKREKFYENVAPDRAAQNVRVVKKCESINKLTMIRARRMFIS